MLKYKAKKFYTIRWLAMLLTKKDLLLKASLFCYLKKSTLITTTDYKMVQ